MKQKKIIFMILSVILVISTIACSGKNNVSSNNEQDDPGKSESTTQQEIADGLTESESNESSEREGEIASEAPKAEDNFSNLPAVDENVYGNSIGNIYNDGLFHCCLNPAGGMLVAPPSSWCMYLFSDMNMYDDSFLTEKEGERPYGISYMDGAIYYTSNAWGLMAYGGEEGKYTAVRPKGASYMQVVNGEIYFTDPGNAKFYKMPKDGGEETLLIDEKVFYPVVYKNIVVFQMDSDKESIYTMSLETGRMEKINDIHSHDLIVYEDYVYYKAKDENENRSIRRLRLDGGDETVLVDLGQDNIFSMNLHNGYYYYILSSVPNIIYYLDLSETNPKPQVLDIESKLKDAITDSKSCKRFEIDSYNKLVFDQEYMFLGTVHYKMDIGSKYGLDEGFADVLYNMETGEMKLMRNWSGAKNITHKKEDVIITQGNVSNRDKIEEGISMVPSKIYQKFTNQGWHIVLTDDPRFADGAVTFYTEHLIYIPDSLGDEISGALLHEMGHFVSTDNGIPYESEEFKKIYEAEKSAFQTTGGLNAKYIDSDMDYFAQVFADICSTGQAESAAPKSFAFVKNCMNKTNK